MKAPIELGQKDIANCPTCGMSVRLIRREGGHADHYEAIDPNIQRIDLLPQDNTTAAKLRKARKGKKTVALVGMSTTSCSLAPYEDKDVEIWSCNQAHAFSWMKRADRWFQIHASKLWDKEIVKREVKGHNDWLRKNEWNIPIYMQYWRDDIPNCKEYPLRAVCDKFFKNVHRGDAKIKYFTSSIAYQIALALYEGRNKEDHDAGIKPFERIEFYGVEMVAGGEFGEQKACAEFWIGVAIGLGVDIYLPDKCLIMYSDLYGEWME